MRIALWCVLTSVVVLLTYDWMRVRIENRELKLENNKIETQATQSTMLVDAEANVLDKCLGTMNSCKNFVESDVERARLILITQVQTYELIRSAQKGDPEALQQLRDLGINLSQKKLTTIAVGYDPRKSAQ
jgi:hypothetical protein